MTRESAERAAGAPLSAPGKQARGQSSSAKRAPDKRAAAPMKSAPKKTAAKKTAAKKSAAKKSAAKKSAAERVAAQAAVSDPRVLSASVVPRVGPARAQQLAQIGVVSVYDLCVLAPKRIEEIGPRVQLGELDANLGRSVSVVGQVASVQWFRGRGRRSTVKVAVTELPARSSAAADLGPPTAARTPVEAGGLAPPKATRPKGPRAGPAAPRVDALFFNQPWARHRFSKGDVVELYGQVVRGSKGLALTTPRVGTAERPLPAAGSLVPLYPLTDGLGQTFLRSLTRVALEAHADSLIERLPDEVLASLDWPTLGAAARAVHAPREADELARAMQRLGAEPLLALQARMRSKRGRGTLGRAFPLRVDADAHAAHLAGLPFEPTPGQRAVFSDLRRDMARRQPMRRLVQGDVGSGKTAIGLYACLAAAASDTQAAFLAPTELLAEQHFAGLEQRLAELGIRSVLLTGSMPAAERGKVLEQLRDGRAQLAFGTHALFGEDVRFSRLALAVIDEQQRFGVAQRRRLLEKGSDVHLLLMTATPIPRTLALTLYGDLQVSRLEGRPGQTASLKTHWLDPLRRNDMLDYLGQRMAAGEHVYWVLPRIDSSDAGAGVLERHAELSAGALGAHGVELVHGAMAASERGARLQRFRDGDARLLVSTTVIEVGVDVPAATQMVIEGADRFGLAQLHQLRGRVGRGTLDSHCYLFGRETARARLEALCRTRDGFELAEEDLRLRGMGQLAGLRQAGTDGISDSERELELLLIARDLLEAHPELVDLYADE